MDSQVRPGFIQSFAANYLSGWLLLICATVAAYWPGLSGPFLFDDFGTLADLGDLGGVRDWDTLSAFVMGGHAGPTGRPLSMLSFLLDGTNWPTDPLPFKRTNLVIHALNGILIGFASAQILIALSVERRAALWAAWAAAAIWLLHPFLISTTLYAVQRMAQLSTLFILSGLNVYLIGRRRLPSNAIQAYVIMSLACTVFTLLAILSKENGILLPALIAVLEMTVYANRNRDGESLNTMWTAVFLWLPCAAILFLLIKLSPAGYFFQTVPTRDFSIYERLLTESRILVDYLLHWFTPDLYSNGVFQDHYQKSSGLLSPISTLFSLLLHAGLISAAVGYRRKFPLLSFSILFYYVSHLLESTTLNLELYFEHRNYLAGAFLALPATAALFTRYRTAIGYSALLAVLVMLFGFTRINAGIWQSYPDIVRSAARVAPGSPRAQQQLSELLYNDQNYDAALRQVDDAIERMPDNDSLHLWRTTIQCQLGILSEAGYQQTEAVLIDKPYNPRLRGLYEQFLQLVAQGACPAASVNDLKRLFSELMLVPINANPNQPLYFEIKFFSGSIETLLGNAGEASVNFRESLASRPSASRAMLMAAVLASGEFYAEAVQFSDIALNLLNDEQQSVVGSSRVIESDIRKFQQDVRRAVANLNGDGE